MGRLALLGEGKTAAAGAGAGAVVKVEGAAKAEGAALIGTRDEAAAPAVSAVGARAIAETGALRKVGNETEVTAGGAAAAIEEDVVLSRDRMSGSPAIPVALVAVAAAVAVVLRPAQGMTLVSQAMLGWVWTHGRGSKLGPV